MFHLTSDYIRLTVKLLLALVRARDWQDSCIGLPQSLKAYAGICGGGRLARLHILVADDNPAFLRTLTSLLKVEFEVVATAACDGTVLETVRRYQPDLVVLDLGMPGLNGIEVTTELAKHPPSPPVVICSVETDPEIVDAARHAGALAYVFKTRIKQDLILAVKSAVQGRPFVSGAHE